MISNLARLKKMMVDKPWLYEEEEHAVMKLAEEALTFITNAGVTPVPCVLAREWLEEHK